MTPATEDALRFIQLADDDAAAFRYDDTDIPLIRDDIVETMVSTMRRWAGEVVTT